MSIGATLYFFQSAKWCVFCAEEQKQQQRQQQQQQ